MLNESVILAYPNDEMLHQNLDADRDGLTVSLVLNCTDFDPTNIRAYRLLEAKSLDEVHELARKAIEQKKIWEEYRDNHLKWFQK